MGGTQIKQEDEEELMNDNVTMVDQNYMNPTFLSNIIHSFPHLDFDFKTIESDYFDPRSSDYNTSLFIIGIVPIIIAALILLSMFGYKKYRERFANINDPKIECVCAIQKLLYGCATMIAIALLTEVLLHLTVHFKFRAIIIPEPRDFTDFQTETMVKISGLNMTPYRRFYGDYLKLNYVEDLYEVYKEAMLKVIAAVIRIRGQQLEPRESHTPLKQYIVIFEWIRFVLSAVLWMMALSIIIWFRRRVILRLDEKRIWAKCSICGVVFCALMAMYLSITIVAVADFCQLPSQTVTVIRPQDLTNVPYLLKSNEHLCQSFRHAMYTSMRNFLWLYQDAKRIVFKNLVAEGDIVDFKTNGKEVNKYWPNITSKFYARKTYSDQVYKVFDEIDNFQFKGVAANWHEKLECSKGVDYFDQPEDVRPLCINNAVLIWMLVQFIAIIVAGIMFVIVLTILVGRVRRIELKDHT